MRRTIYADNAATTQLDAEAFEAMKPYMLNEFGNPSQPYSFSRNTKKALEDSRATIAECIGAYADEIFFTSGGTESDNWAIKGCAFANNEKRATITSAIEHHAVLKSCEAIERLGFPVAYIWPDHDGVVAPSSLSRIITSKTNLVSIMLANNEIGTVEPIRELAEMAHHNGALFHTDAVQAVGHIPIDVQALGVDLLSASAHKFHGPRGVGFLYVKRGTTISSYMTGGGQESGLRAGTQNVPAIVGMACALKKAVNSLQSDLAYVSSLEELLLSTLETNGVRYRRNGGRDILPGLISLSFDGFDGEAILHRMDLKGIAISTGSACNGASTEISHVLRAIRLDDSCAKGTIRISLGTNNTEEDVNTIAKELSAIVSERW